MTELPAPFQAVFTEWEKQDIKVLETDWTTPLKRHVGAKVKYNGDLCFAKLAIAKKGDLDESDMLQGMRREVWWSQVIQRLRQENTSFPFTSPRVFAINVNQQPFQDEVAWVIMEFIDGVPLLDWEHESTAERIRIIEEDDPRVNWLNGMFDAAVIALRALEQIHPRTLEDLGLPPLPSPPHGMRRWQKKGVLNMETAVLGNGAWEMKNFWRGSGSELVIMDNEFAGWYPKHDHLSYLYHRLYCNDMRPDLATRMLSRYVWQAFQAGEFNDSPDSMLDFSKSFARILKPRVLGGWYYDTVRRKLMPWHRKQRLRYRLLWQLWRRNYHKLMDS
jgi:hypothetical protein